MRPVSSHPAHAAASSADGEVPPASSSGRPDREPVPSTIAAGPQPGQGPKPSTGGRPGLPAGGLGDRPGDEVLGGLLERPGPAQQVPADPGAGSTSATPSPAVTVPVLSSTTVSTCRDASRAW